MTISTVEKATKLSNTTKIGDTNKPVYFTANGVPAVISYTIEANVPKNADFEDTKVTQTETTDSSHRYAILLSSETSDNDAGSTITSTTRKASNFSYNPTLTRLRISRADHANGQGLYLINSDSTDPLNLAFGISPSDHHGGIERLNAQLTTKEWIVKVPSTGTATFYGNLNGNADTATKLSNTPNNTTTYLRGDNSWQTLISSGNSTLAWNSEITLATVGGTNIKAKLPVNPNTDTLVKQTAKTDNVNYKLLMGANSSPTSGTAYEAVYDTAITVNPSTHTITAKTFNSTSLTASQAVSTDANKNLVSTNLTTADPTASGTGITYIASIS